MADLKGAVEEVLRPRFEVENPVTRARGIEKLDEHAMPGLDVLRTEIRELKAQIASVARLAATSRSAPALGSQVPGLLGEALSNGTLFLDPDAHRSARFGDAPFASVFGDPTASERNYAAELNAIAAGGPLTASTAFGQLSPKAPKKDETPRRR